MIATAALSPIANPIAPTLLAEQFPVVLPLELDKQVWRKQGQVVEHCDLETSASGFAEVAFELFLEQSIEQNETLLDRCLPRGRGIITKRKAYSLPPDLIKRFKERCKRLNDREDRLGALKASIVAEAAFSRLLAMDLDELVDALKRFNVRKRRK